MSSTSSLEQADPLPNLRDANLDLILQLMDERTSLLLDTLITGGIDTPVMDLQRVDSLNSVTYRSVSSRTHSEEDRGLATRDQYLDTLNTSDSGSQSAPIFKEIPIPTDRTEPPDRNLNHIEVETIINPSGQKELAEKPGACSKEEQVDKREQRKTGRSYGTQYNFHDPPFDPRGNFETRHEFHDPPIDHSGTGKTHPVHAHRDSTQEEKRIHPSLQTYCHWRQQTETCQCFRHPEPGKGIGKPFQ